MIIFTVASPSSRTRKEMGNGGREGGREKVGRKEEKGRERVDLSGRVHTSFCANTE